MIYCFDIDGTICYNEKEKAVPIQSRIDFINELYATGHKIIFETARGSVTSKDWCDFTAMQLIKWGVQYHELRCGKKIHADIYIDDKGVNDKAFFKDGLTDEYGLPTTKEW